MEISERKKRILGAIVETYIATGEPVGSKILVEATGMGLSSATIRNEMSELAEIGYLEQPHTSAGRVPSQAGYRFYVDRLMGRRDLTSEEIEKINGLLRIREDDIEGIIEKAGKILAEVTGFTALSTTPKSNGAVLNRVEAVPAGRRSVLLIILTDSGIIRSKLCRLNEDHNPDMLRFFSRLVNDRLGGKPLEAITDATLNGMSSELYEYTFALKPLIASLGEEIKDFFGSEVFLGGEANLFNNIGFDDGRLHDIINMLDQRNKLAILVDGVKNGVEVRIGTENGLRTMNGSSVVAAPYAFNGTAAGAVGIIGPTRMDYAKMVSNIEYFSAVLSKLINKAFGTF